MSWTVIFQLSGSYCKSIELDSDRTASTTLVEKLQLREIDQTSYPGISSGASLHQAKLSAPGAPANNTLCNKGFHTRIGPKALRFLFPRLQMTTMRHVRHCEPDESRNETKDATFRNNQQQLQTPLHCQFRPVYLRRAALQNVMCK